MIKKGLIIFIKSPEPGKVKTRIAETLGGAFAAGFYKACAGHALNECMKIKGSGIDLYIFYSNPGDDYRIKSWVPENFKLVCQQGENLGERLYNAFSFLFKSKYDKIILTGSDIPDISASLIEKSFEYLDNHNAVIGPSWDGGYYLLGLTKLYKDIFEKIPWSTDKVYNFTLKKFKERKISYKQIQKLIDIDKEDDIIEWLKGNPRDDHPVKLFFCTNYKKV